MSMLKNPVTLQDHLQGNTKAAITLVEYGDYQCPYCGEAYPIVKQIQKKFGEKLLFVFRNFPLAQIHPFAEPSAEAAEFAASKNLFWEMHDALYENQESLSLPFLLELAERLKIPSRDLAQALEQRIFLPKVKNDFLGGVRSGVNGTPTFFINGERYNGTVEGLLEAIDSATLKIPS